MPTNLFSNYKTKLHAAWSERAASGFPRTGRMVAVFVLLVFVYIVLATQLRPRASAPEYHFIQEAGGAITALSAIFLAIAAGLAFVAYFLARQKSAPDSAFYLLLSAAYAFLSFDELLEIHEHIGGLLSDTSAQAGPFRNWNDLVVIGYGLIALVIVAYFLPAVLRNKRFATYFGFGALFYMLHTLIDSTVEPATTSSMILEESMKLYCGFCLAISAFMLALGVVFRKNAPVTS